MSKNPYYRFIDLVRQRNVNLPLVTEVFKKKHPNGLSNPLIFGHKKNQSRTLAAAVDSQNFSSGFPALLE